MKPVKLAICLALLAAAPAGANSLGAPVAAPVDQAVLLDDLYLELKRAPDPQAAGRIAERIRVQLSRSGSATIDLMVGWADTALQSQDYAVALDFLDQVVTLAPDYAEGWNRRATVHFLMEDHAKSMADISRTLRLEPRHFGALGGMAQILRDSGRKERALEAYLRVLEVYPQLRPAQNAAGQLADEIAGEGI